MKLSTLACLAALGLIGPAALTAAAQTVAPGTPGIAAGRAGPPGVRGERRRGSYAFCNRESHKRSLSGGRRRRFLIRCKLGYERKRAPQALQPAQAPAERKP
ncbi:hypothetical protein [uncultured Methylobacterium sp.]|uniref:hypothetical protein n=1 Tax=uncultured Methylobacterium sp. TaxID=157278 RepID=UPI0035CAA874